MREATARAQCQNNLKQMGLAVHNYHDTNGTLPPDRIANTWPTWAVLILPYLEQDNVYKQWDLQKRYARRPYFPPPAPDVPVPLVPPAVRGERGQPREGRQLPGRAGAQLGQVGQERPADDRPDARHRPQLPVPRPPRRVPPHGRGHLPVQLGDPILQPRHVRLDPGRDGLRHARPRPVPLGTRIEVSCRRRSRSVASPARPASASAIGGRADDGRDVGEDDGIAVEDLVARTWTVIRCPTPSPSAGPLPHLLEPGRGRVRRPADRNVRPIQFTIRVTVSILSSAGFPTPAEDRL